MLLLLQIKGRPGIKKNQNNTSGSMFTTSTKFCKHKTHKISINLSYKAHDFWGPSCFKPYFPYVCVEQTSHLDSYHHNHISPHNDKLSRNLTS